MIRSSPDRFTLIYAGMLWLVSMQAFALEAPECRGLELAAYSYSGPAIYDRGLLWRIEGNAATPSHLFGTIHVADREILAIPTPVSEALAASKVFVMETLPDLEQLAALPELLFFQQGESLRKLISRPLFDRTAEILEAYFLSPENVSRIKPWAAFLTMNYPAGSGAVLDEMLLNRALEQGAATHGLESMREQLDIFEDLPQDQQLRLLADTVCHYEVVTDDFAVMKRLYLSRDLKGLYEYSNRYAATDEPMYKELLTNLLTRRNQVMAERMLPYLEQGAAFIAVGAMHLPGDEGILSLLRERGFKLVPLY
ncbi:MAG: TraB/GumN family protein [Gammaproteobacteria bacterium]|nr:MAG: TraB/GumN family protein [Gammaproteobacteria bacterium]